MPFYKINKFFFFFLLVANLASSQNYPGKNYTASNELPNNAVRSLLVDSNNILWIGTENGVVKKENDVFSYFFEEDGLALNSCWAIAEDKNGNLWFGSYGAGLSIFDGYNFKILSKKDGLANNEITTLLSDGDYMYVGTSDGISLVNHNSLEVISLEHNDDKPFRVQDFFTFRDQVFVVTYNSGIYQIKDNKGQKYLVKLNDHKFIYSVLVENDTIYSSNKGFYTKSRIEDYIDERDSLFTTQLGKSVIWDHVKSVDNSIFAAAWGIYDGSGGIYELVNNQMISQAVEFNIPSKEVISLAYDPLFERLYVGTGDAGLFEISLNPQIKFKAINDKKVLGFAQTKNTSALLLNDAVVLTQDGKEKRITGQHLKKWQETFINNTTRPLPKHVDDFYELNYNTNARDISFYDIKTHRDIFWINTNIGIFAILDSGELQRYLPLHSEEINFTPAGNLIETNPYGGVRVYNDLDSFEYTHYDQLKPPTPTMIVSSLKKENKTYFLSIFSGLYVWENNQFKSYLKEGIWKEKKLKHITTLGENLAISNEFGDVFIVSDRSLFKVLKKIPRAQINGNSISFLKEYNGNLIIGTEKGLTLYKENRFIFIDKEQGLQQPLLSARVDQNLLSIGSNDGIYIIDLDAISDTKELIYDVGLKEIFINNNKSSAGQINDGDKIQLPYYENTVLIKFSTNAHPFPRKLSYQYRLNPDENWSLPSPTPEIFLASLPTKNYDVAVKVNDLSTGLSYTEPLLSFSILPPFWKTWWFALLLTGILLSGIFVMYKYQLMQNRKFEEQKGLIQKRFEETKMEALLAQMNPHFIFNAMNSIQYYIMDNDIDNATVFLGDFAKLIRLNLDHCTKPTILLTEEIDYLQSYIRVENTRFNNSINVLIEIDPKIDIYNTEIPTMLLQTFVENVFVHAFPPGIKDPTLKISFLLLFEGLLQCKIEDNGIGYTLNSGNKLHQSKGVSLVKERLALLGYEIDDAVQIISEKNKGTSVILTLRI